MKLYNLVFISCLSALYAVSAFSTTPTKKYPLEKKIEQELKINIKNKLASAEDPIYKKSKECALVEDLIYCGQGNNPTQVVEGYVRECKNSSKHPFWGTYYWDENCKLSICNEGNPPSDINNHYVWNHTGSYCWTWDCENGYQKQEDECLIICDQGYERTAENTCVPTEETLAHYKSQQTQLNYKTLLQDINNELQTLEQEYKNRCLNKK